MCHEGSTSYGLHGDILNPSFINTLQPYTECACLSGNTIVYNKDGIKYVEDLKVGDYIFDSENLSRKIISIKKISKKIVNIKGSKGFKATCSEDHPFVIDGNIVQAKDVQGKEIDRLRPVENYKEEEYTIDMLQYINKKSNKLGSRGGKLLENNIVRLTNSSKHTPRYIKLTEDLMWLYGLFVAEGSTKGVVLNINETEYIEKVKRIWQETFGLNVRIFNNFVKNSSSVEFSSSSILKKLFYDEFKICKGSRNVSIAYLFNINNRNLIKSALSGLFDGDGCYKERIQRGVTTRSVCLKTTSKKLAYEVQYLLAKWFGIYSSIDYGISKQRKIEDRILKESDYYNLSIYGIKDINKIFSDKYGVEQFKETWNNNEKYSGIKIKSVDYLTEEEDVYDITIDGGTHIFPINGYALTHNCGGGDPLSHPDLLEFLQILKYKNIIANITVNQKHFLESQEFIQKLVNDKLIYGLGVSVVKVDDNLIEMMQKYPNAVVHVINGIIDENNLDKMYNKNLKLLILGYKEFRRGKYFYSTEVEDKKLKMYDLLPKILNKFKVVSFDNLAIKQLDVKRLLSEDKWNEFYMGDDGQYTMYIDLVENKFAKSSISEIRYDLLDNIVDMFDVVRNENITMKV
jgi:hypothetical protein